MSRPADGINLASTADRTAAGHYHPRRMAFLKDRYELCKLLPVPVSPSIDCCIRCVKNAAVAAIGLGPTHFPPPVYCRTSLPMSNDYFCV